MRSLAMLSLHTSPLEQPGSGDSGGMNVYVRELGSALARLGISCHVFTRASVPDHPREVRLEPGLTVHHVPCGPAARIPKESLAAHVPQFTEGVLARIRELGNRGEVVEAVHANYWLSGLTGHVVKHELGIPLLSTFHTLDRVKAEASPEELAAGEPTRRAEAEAEVIACSDAVLASCEVESDQLCELYGADPARIAIVPPGVDHAFFSPGYRPQARRALALPVPEQVDGARSQGAVPGRAGPEDAGAAGTGPTDTGSPLVLFVGRIQPLKGLQVALEAFAHVLRTHPGAQLCVVGGPSGPHGEAELARVQRAVEELDIAGRVHFVPPQSHELLSTYYRAADVCLIPSRSESFGLVALEAAACGTPVVAGAVGGLTTLVEDGRTGFLVPGRDPEAFAAAMTAVLDDSELAVDMAAAAAERARAFTWRHAAEKVLCLGDMLGSASLVACG